jgi:EAL domain-containing protein (putative c-di-GMP-specific phosphodiesterase class I)/CheY-like chemotaxis protein
VLAFVLDDEPATRRLICRILSQNGFSPSAFATSADLFTALLASSPEVLVLDLALGQSDAIDVIRHLEATGFSGKVQLVSGHDEGTLREAHRIGMSHHLAMLPPLPKPFCAGDLVASLAAKADTTKKASVNVVRAGQPRADIVEALEKSWLELWYQPKYDLRARRINAAEALLRLRHPDHGVLTPASFLPPAGHPAYEPLAEYVLRRAMADWQYLAEGGVPLKIAVNMPVSVISRPDFVNLVRLLVIKDPGFPGMLIEITEDEVVADSDLVREIATQLKLANVHLSIDDVGSGYSALSRFVDLAFVEVKIGANLVRNCATDTSRQTICRMIAELAHDFGATACAEGVENSADLRAVEAIGCDSVQGFYFGRASPPSALLRELRSQSVGAQE